MIDLSTRAGAFRFAELRRGELVHQYLAKGELEPNPLLYLFVTHELRIDLSLNPPLRVGRKVPKPVAVACPMPSMVRKMDPKRRTRVFGDAMRDIARASKAVGILLVMDAWFSSSDKAPPDHHYGWIEENQDGEGLMVRLEHRALSRPYAWGAMIHRDPLRLDPWRGGEQREGSSETSRLANFIDWRS